MIQLDVTIMGQPYRLACKEGEQAPLLEAVAYLDGKMNALRDAAKVKGRGRVRQCGQQGLDADLGVAYAKSQMAANSPLPARGKIFISVSDSHKKEVAAVARQFSDLGFELVATSGTAAVLEQAGLKVQRILKLLEGRPNVIDLLKNKEIQLVINTPAGQSPREDEVKIRTTAVYTGTPIMTTLSGAKAAALGIAALKKSGYAVKTLQEYH